MWFDLFVFAYKCYITKVIIRLKLLPRYFNISFKLIPLRKIVNHILTFNLKLLPYGFLEHINYQVLFHNIHSRFSQSVLFPVASLISFMALSLCLSLSNPPNPTVSIWSSCPRFYQLSQYSPHSSFLSIMWMFSSEYQSYHQNLFISPFLSVTSIWNSFISKIFSTKSRSLLTKKIKSRSQSLIKIKSSVCNIKY